ncbi:MAG: carbon storage regulator CsrA [Chloroflexota bacterium]
MLVLSRKVGEVITIGSSVTVTVLSYDRGIVRIGIEAPKSVPVHRKEIHDKIVSINRIAARTELGAIRNLLSLNAVKFAEDRQKIDLPSVNTNKSQEESAND